VELGFAQLVIRGILVVKVP